MSNAYKFVALWGVFFSALCITSGCNKDDDVSTTEDTRLEVTSVPLLPAPELPASSYFIGPIINHQVLANGPRSERGTLMESTFRQGSFGQPRLIDPFPDEASTIELTALGDRILVYNQPSDRPQLTSVMYTGYGQSYPVSLCQNVPGKCFATHFRPSAAGMVLLELNREKVAEVDYWLRYLPREGSADVLVHALPTTTGRIELLGTVDRNGVQFGAYVIVASNNTLTITPFSFSHADPQGTYREGVRQALGLTFLAGPGWDVASLYGNSFSLVLGTKAEVGFEWSTEDLSLESTGLFGPTDFRSAVSASNYYGQDFRAQQGLNGYVLGHRETDSPLDYGSIYRLEGNQLRTIWNGNMARLKPRDEKFGLGAQFYGGGRWFVFGRDGENLYLYDDFSILQLNVSSGEITGAWETLTPGNVTLNSERGYIKAINYESGFVNILAVRFGGFAETDVDDVFTARFKVQ